MAVKKIKRQRQRPCRNTEKQFRRNEESCPNPRSSAVFPILRIRRPIASTESFFTVARPTGSGVSLPPPALPATTSPLFDPRWSRPATTFLAHPHVKITDLKQSFLNSQRAVRQVTRAEKLSTTPQQQHKYNRSSSFQTLYCPASKLSGSAPLTAARFRARYSRATIRAPIVKKHVPNRKVRKSLSYRAIPSVPWKT